MQKSEYPAAIGELLDIPPMITEYGLWMSRGDTVRQEWLQAVGEALDIPYSGYKVSMMRRLVEAVGETWDPATMTSEQTASGGGGNISRPAFEALYAGLLANPTALARHRANSGGGDYDAPAPDRADDDTAMRAIRVRRGQRQFRTALLHAYDARCAITGYDAVPVLEAAHIVAYGDGGTYETSNGLLLRADLHTLFDLRLLSFSGRPEFEVALHPQLTATSYGPELETARLRLPSNTGDWPSETGLAVHRASCEF